MRLIAATLLCLMSPAVAQPTLPRIDVFAITGQSVAVGHGAGPAIPVPATVLQWNGSAIVSGADPVGGAPLGTATGTAWPSFGAMYTALTGHAILFVPCASDGSAQTQAVAVLNGALSWDTAGTLVPTCFARIDAAIAAVNAAGQYAPRLAGALHDQGQSEGSAMITNPNFGDVTDYDTAFANMITRFRTVYPGLPFFVFGIGAPLSTGPYGYTAPGFAMIRAAQQQRAEADSRVKIVFGDAVQFEAQGMLADNIHPTQDGYNWMGQQAATAVAGSGLVD